MKVVQRHKLGQAEAIKRIDSFLDKLMAREPPAGVTIKNPQKTWNGNRMDFAFNASRGFFGTTIAGNMKVTDDTVELDSELPGMVKTFVGEDTVRDVIARELGRILEE
jgi:hypothetical protein